MKKTKPKRPGQKLTSKSSFTIRSNQPIFQTKKLTRQERREQERKNNKE